jgi:hypothetical protein
MQLVAVDIHRRFMNAILSDPAPKHLAVVHDPLHTMKRAGEDHLSIALTVRAQDL